MGLSWSDVNQLPEQTAIGLLDAMQEINQSVDARLSGDTERQVFKSARRKKASA